MSLIDIARISLFSKVIESENVLKYCKPKYPGDLNKVLIVDDDNLQFVKELTNLAELNEKGYISIQKISLTLQPLTIHLIYLISANDENISAIIDTFSQAKCPFLSTHIFCSNIISESIMNKLKGCKNLLPKLKSLVQLPYSFVVEANNVFTLGSNMTITDLYGSSSNKSDQIVHKILNLLIVANDNPTIRYMSDSDISEEVAGKLSAKLVGLSTKNIEFGREDGRRKIAQLVILERWFDQKTPFMHDISLEPAARDLLEVENNTIEFKLSGNENIKVSLNDPGEPWQRLRYKYLPDAMPEIAQQLKEISAMNNMSIPEGTMSVAQLRRFMTKYPEQKANLKRYQNLTILVENCMNAFKSNNIEDLIQAEQDFATNLSKNGEPISDNPVGYVNLLEDIKSPEDRLRLVALYVLKSGTGVSSKTFDKLVEISKNDDASKRLRALEKLNFSVFQGSDKHRKYESSCEDDNDVTGGYVVSRYIPTFWNILKQTALNRLDEKKFPFLGEKNMLSVVSDVPESADFGFGKYNKKKSESQKKARPRLYVIVIGGVCYSEIRLLNVFQDKFPDIDVFVGGTELLTPRSFMNHLKHI